MTLFARLSCLLVLAATPLIARCDDTATFKFNFQLMERKNYATLDDLSASLLNDPYVLVEVGVKRSQIVLIPFRERTNKMFAAMGVTQASAAESTEEGNALAVETLKSFQAASGVILSDLNGAQRMKLQRVALRDHAMESLLTKEVDFALRLNPEQQKRLKTIRDEYWTRCGKIEGKHTDNAKVLKLIKSYGEADVDTLTAGQKFNALKDICDKVAVMLAKTAAVIEEPIAQATKDANARALRVLTASQAKQYRQLQTR